jgi:hypothetical protein
MSAQTIGDRLVVEEVAQIGTWFELRPDFHHRSVRHELPDFVDFLVGDSDAAVSPVALAVCVADPSHAVRKAVNHDVTPGWQA